MPNCLVVEYICSRGTAIQNILQESLKTKARTITSDIGFEFVEHESIAQNHNAQLYFVLPYPSGESVLN